MSLQPLNAIVPVDDEIVDADWRVMPNMDNARAFFVFNAIYLAGTITAYAFMGNLPDHYGWTMPAIMLTDIGIAVNEACRDIF
jgi:hypothetical protein